MKQLRKRLFFYVKKAVNTLTPKQKRFCDEYLIDLNATQAAIRAGYSEKTAYSIGTGNLKKLELKTYIDEQLRQIHDAKIAEAAEVMQYLTSVMRGETKSEVLSLCGDGCQEVIEKAPDEKERLKAAELLGKTHGIFKDKVEHSGEINNPFAGLTEEELRKLAGDDD